jgi:hypothetical protein
VERVRVGDLQRLAVALDARLELNLFWRGASLDRLIDEAHAEPVDAIVRWLIALGWELAVEASFAIYGERGSIDVFARHPSGALLVVEAKASIGEANQTLMALDRKVRLAPEVATQRRWAVGPIGALLVVAESTTSRDRIRRHAATFGHALATPSAECRRWSVIRWAGRRVGSSSSPRGIPPAGTPREAADDIAASARSGWARTFTRFPPREHRATRRPAAFPGRESGDSAGGGRAVARLNASSARCGSARCGSARCG